MNKSAPDETGATGHFERALRAGRFVMTAEVTPPLSCERDDLLAKALPLRGLADAVNVTDGAGARAHMGALGAASILLQNGIEPILQLTCRDRNRIALQSDLLAAAALGIRNLLILRGDDPSAGDQPDTKPVFDLDSRALLRTAAAIRDRGELPNGRKIAGAARFFLGAAETPIDAPPSWQPNAVRAKIEAGAQFIQTQFCMDVGVVERFTRRLAEAGISDNFYLLIGVAPLRSAKSARWMKRHLFGTIIPDTMVERMERAADPPAEGRRICLEHLEALAEIAGVAGAHIMAPNHEEAIPEVLASFGRRQRKSRAAPPSAGRSAQFTHPG